MREQNLSDLIQKAKESKPKTPLQETVPIKRKLSDKEKQCSFYLSEELYKKIKLRALQEDTTIKTIITKSIETYLDNIA